LSHLFTVTETNLKLTTPSDREIAMTRVFDAPRSGVFDALTRPEVLKRYFATPGWSLVVCEIDLKARGAYRYVWCRNLETILALIRTTDFIPRS
jgi:sulfur transfer complex TusBCD TusB component (DsrH family)